MSDEVKWQRAFDQPFRPFVTCAFEALDRKYPAEIVKTDLDGYALIVRNQSQYARWWEVRIFDAAGKARVEVKTGNAMQGKEWFLSEMVPDLEQCGAVKPR